MTELIVRGVRKTPAINWRGVPMSMHGKVSAVCRSQAECEDLVHWYGDPAFCPFLPVLIMVPGHPCLMLMGLGEATAAELRDDAVGLWAQKSETLRKTGSVLDFDSLRERHGLMRREDVEAATAEAMMDRIRRHKASPVTDPVRQVRHLNPTNRTVFPVGDAVLPKEVSA